MRAILDKIKNLLFPQEEVLWALKNLPKGSVCAEIGVWKGESSQEILDIVKPKKLHLIDPWIFQPQYKTRWYGGGIAKSQKDMDKIYLDVRKKFSKESRVVIHRVPSEKIFKKFKDNYFDWIFVDGNHSYKYVLGDITNFLPKIKKGGYILGDDYWWGPTEGFPVRKAVDLVLNKKLVTKKFIKKRIYWLQKEK